MTKQPAIAVAVALRGEPYHSGGGIWLVRITCPDGRLILLSDEGVSEYANADEGVYGEEVNGIKFI